MVDIHHHLLPGLDDGSTDMATSIAMARMAVDEGITHVVCTPHANGRYPYDRDRNVTLLRELQQKLEFEDVPLTLGLGSDFHISYDNVQEALVDAKRFTINATRYLLIELPDYGIPPAITESFLAMQKTGLRLILTHPERNPTLVANPKRMTEWLRNGMLVQVTAGSVTGKMGKIPQSMAHDLLARNAVHFIATDAHNTSWRPPLMREAREMIERRFGPEKARMLFETNPEAVFKGEPLGVQEEPLEFAEQEPAKSWVDRLLRR